MLRFGLVGMLAAGIATLLTGAGAWGEEAESQAVPRPRQGEDAIASEEDAECQAEARLWELGVRISWEEYAGKALLKADFTSLSDKCTKKDLALVRQLNSIRGVKLMGEGLTDDALIENLATLKKLESVTLICTYVSDAGLQRLCEVSNLRELHLLHCWCIGEPGLCHLKNLKNLEVLSVTDNPRAHDGWLAGLRGGKIRDLDLSGSSISNKGVQMLQKFRSLESLDLYLTRVTDECLPDLRAMPKLRTLSLSETRVTNLEVEVLRKNRPDMRIYH